MTLEEFGYQVLKIYAEEEGDLEVGGYDQTIHIGARVEQLVEEDGDLRQLLTGIQTQQERPT